MEIRQFRYFVCVVRQGSLGKAARELGVVPSTLSQQISRLESELSTRLLQRTHQGVIPTDAGIAFFRQAQLALRHVDEAVRSAQSARLAGHVSVGLAPTTASVVALPLLIAMRQQYPDVRFHLVESLSGHLAAMLKSRQLDLAILFGDEPNWGCSVMPLFEESLYVMAKVGFAGFPEGDSVPLARLGDLPLAMPTHMHGLRSVLSTAADRHALGLNIVMEIDSLAVLMDAVAAGLVATIQPDAAISRAGRTQLQAARISDQWLSRRGYLVSLSDDELSPAALAARVVMRNVARGLVAQGDWVGVSDFSRTAEPSAGAEGL
ncbi:LysR substrate-binding domain-containing protein [Castellaniella sp.]|uniref:LysR substrate-binding domain-containing protein n=1 Tax=Castellaniella sp. TaxID=1955812 RepID=UPI003C7348DB